MHLNLSKSIILLTLPIWLYGCRQSHDLAPVVSNDRRFDGYYRDTTGQSRKSDDANRSLPAIEQNAVGSNQKIIEIEPKPDKEDKKKTKSEEPLLPEFKYHVVKKGETLYAIGVGTGYGIEKLAMWNRLAPPYHIEAGQKIRLFNPLFTDKEVSAKSITDTVEGNPDNSRKNKSILSSNKQIKLQKKTLSKRLKSDKNQDNNKKKSIISIDNNNMLMLDFQWPVKGKIRKTFSQTDNKGIDIGGAVGQTVRASEAGKVVYSGQGLIGFGNLLIIKHNDDYLSAYANTSNAFVKEGQQVKKGQGIAKIGAAVSNKSVLHFEIRKNGKSVNPLSLLPKID